MTGEDLVLGLSFATVILSGWLSVKLVRRVRRPQSYPTWCRLVIGNAVLLLLFLSLLFLGGETYYRFIYDKTDSLLYSKVSQRWLRQHWHRNANGLRDDMEYSPFRSLTRRRISFVGDSFTAGHGIKNVKHRFVNLIRERNPSWEVHMLAMPGFDTGDELDFLRTCLDHGYQLDEVVLVYCLNDVSDMIEQRYQGI